MTFDESMLEPYLKETREKIDELNEGLLEYEDKKNENSLDKAFRAAHTIKGSSASMGLDEISELTHKIESLFDELKNDNLDSSDKLFDLLYSSIDTLERLVDIVEENKARPEKDVSRLVDALVKASNNEEFEVVDLSDSSEDEEEISEVNVDIERLDKMMNLIGEMLVIQKKIKKESEEENYQIDSKLEQLERLLQEVRRETSEARMIPVSHVFQRFPRTVRDLVSGTEKEVNFEIKDNGLEMDRNIVEEVSEPIIHCLRNAVDHGIEKPEARKEKDKAEEGKLTLKAQRKGSEAQIVVEDDGKGIDPSKIREKALEQDIIDQEDNLSDQEKLELLFRSGFSTNDEVTKVSGRGVGLNIVKQTAEELHGSYSIDTSKGEGTSIKMTLPLSLAVIKSFVVELSGNKYGIPIESVLRVLDFDEQQKENLESEEVMIFNEEEIPLLKLSKRFHGSSTDSPDNIIVVERGSEKAGIIIDDIIDVQEFVTKKLHLIEIDEAAGVSMTSNGKPIIILNFNKILGDSR